MIIRDNFLLIPYKQYAVTPHLNRQDGSDEGSQHMVLMRNKKNYHQILPPI